MPICEFCHKTLKTEKGFQNHMCTKKKRFIEFNEPAYYVWLLIHNIFHLHLPDDSKKKMTFINDTLYEKICDFTKWVLETDVINLYEYLMFLKTNNVKINDWKNSRNYHIWLVSYLRGESDAIAIERSVKYLNKHEYNINDISINRMYMLIMYGHISVKYLKSIQYDFTQFDEQQLKNLEPYIFSMEEILNKRL